MESNSILDAENMVLGAIFLEPDIIHEITLEPEYFSISKNRIIFKAMRELAAANITIDVVTLTDQLGDKIENVGGISYLSDLAIYCPSTENIQVYENIVIENYKKRKLINAAQQALNKQTEEAFDKFYQTYIEVQEVGRNDEQTTQDVLTEIYEEMHQDQGGLTGVDTGFADINKMTGGFQNGDLIIVAARPSVGKTALALNFSLNCCKSGGVSDVFSLEMPKKQLVQRMLSSIARINGAKWRNPYRMFSEQDFKKANKAIGIFGELDIYIHDEPNQTVADIRAAVRRTQRRHPDRKHLVVIDYLQLITILGKFERNDIAIGSLTRELKQMARQFNVPVVLLSQLSRAVEQRQDKRPILSDLRDSGNIEQDADIVMLLYREDYYEKERKDNLIEINIAKHRNGPIGTVKLLFEKEYSLFLNLAKDRGEEE